MKRVIFAVIAFTFLLCMAACANTSRQMLDILQGETISDIGLSGQGSGTMDNPTESATSETEESKDETAEMKMKVQIGNVTFRII